MTLITRVRTFLDGYPHHPSCDQIYLYRQDTYAYEIGGTESWDWICDCHYAAIMDEI